MFKTTKLTKPTLNMKLAKLITTMKQQKEKIKQKIKQKAEKKNHAIMDLTEIKVIKHTHKTEFEDEFGDLESMSFEEERDIPYAIYEEDDIELGCNLQ